MKFAVLSGAVVFGGYLAGIAGGHPHREYISLRGIES